MISGLKCFWNDRVDLGQRGSSLHGAQGSSHTSVCVKLCKLHYPICRIDIFVPALCKAPNESKCCARNLVSFSERAGLHSEHVA